MPCYAMLYYITILYSTLLYSTLLYSTLLYSTILYYTILYYTILLASAPALPRPAAGCLPPSPQSRTARSHSRASEPLPDPLDQSPAFVPVLAADAYDKFGNFDANQPKNGPAGRPGYYAKVVIVEVVIAAWAKISYQ